MDINEDIPEEEEMERWHFFYQTCLSIQQSSSPPPPPPPSPPPPPLYHSHRKFGKKKKRNIRMIYMLRMKSELIVMDQFTRNDFRSKDHNHRMYHLTFSKNSKIMNFSQ